MASRYDARWTRTAESGLGVPRPVRDDTAVRILVTGATGLVGRHVVARLASEAHHVTALALNGEHLAWRRGVRPVSMDLLQASEPTGGLAGLLRGHDVVVHAAGPVAGTASALRAVHVEGTTRLADAAIAAGVRSFVHVSTLAVHAMPAGGEALDESTPFCELYPDWMHYAAAKRDAERVLGEYAGRGGMRVCVLRPGIVFGAGDRHTTPLMLAALRRGGQVHIGSGTRHPPCICASDLADAVAAAIHHTLPEFEAFVLAGPEPPTQAELWHWHARAAGLTVPKGYVPESLAMLAAGILERAAANRRTSMPATRFDVFALSSDVMVNAGKAMQALGWRPRAAFGEAILAAVQESNGRRPALELHPQGAP